MNSGEMLNKHGAIYLSKILPIEFCHFFTHVLMCQADREDEKGDGQIPNAKAILHHEVMFETLQERLWPLIEKIVGEELLPTYAYARLYSNGDVLKEHRDRPACEVSVTIQLGRSHHYAWPIYMGGNRYDIAEGDGVVYLGNEIPHWRNACDGPESYYSGQLFLHYVKKNGQHASHAADPVKRIIPATYTKNRTLLMESK
jgi:hypothetical protein